MPIDYDQYPLAADVQALFVNGLEAYAPSDEEADAVVLEAVADWERGTRYKPFLITSSVEPLSFAYDPPGPNQKGLCRGGGTTLLFKRGFVTILSVTAGVTLTDAGTLLTEGVDFDLLPENATVDGVPYTSLEFRCRRYGPPRSILVNGRSAYCTTLPPNAWAGIRDLAAAKHVSKLREQLGGDGIKQERSGDDQITYADMFTQGEAWQSQGMRVLRGFVRMN